MTSDRPQIEARCAWLCSAAVRRRLVVCGWLALLAGALAACAPARSPVAASTPAARVGVASGHLVLIGGGPKPDDAVDRFVALAGGAESTIVVLPMASSDSRPAGADYINLFRAHGAGDVVVLHIDDRRDAERASHVRALRAATAVFFSGGDQSRIAARIVDTPVLDAVRGVLARGGVVGGTSAGTACQSAVMLVGDGSSGSPDRDIELRVSNANALPASSGEPAERLRAYGRGEVPVARGIGLFAGVVMDSHFLARRRQPRLVGAILERPELLGIGVDEGTAAWVKPDGTMEILGASAVVVFEATSSGVLEHTLTRGESFDLNRRARVSR